MYNYCVGNLHTPEIRSPFFPCILTNWFNIRVLEWWLQLLSNPYVLWKYFLTYNIDLLLKLFEWKIHQVSFWTEIVQVLLISNFQNFTTWRQTGGMDSPSVMKNLTHRVLEVREWCMMWLMADSSLWGSMKADKDVFGRFWFVVSS